MGFEGTLRPRRSPKVASQSPSSPQLSLNILAAWIYDKKLQEMMVLVVKRRQPYSRLQKVGIWT